MRTTLKATIVAMALTGAAAMAGPAAAQQFGLGIGPSGGISFSYDSGGYCDQWGCPDDFWDMPVYYGAVFADGQWFDGPVYYRDWRGDRQYWIHGRWRRDEWRGPHPGWWREGRYGPALGMDYYRGHNFHGRWDQDRGYGRGPGFERGGDRGREFNRGDDRRNDRGGRNGFNGPPNNQPGNQAQQSRPPQNAAPGDDRGGRHFDHRNDGAQRSNPVQQAPAAAPAPAAPPAQGGDRGEHRHRDRN